MTAKDLREKFLKFMESKGHTIIPSASLVPSEVDPSVLFTTAGMQQFKEYYLNPEVSKDARIATIQKCIRTGDIDEVGDKTHLTFFEMLGNFSFGYPDKKDSYFKQDSINYAWEFLTKVLEIDKKRIYATYFKGEKGVAEDLESLKILKGINSLDKIMPQGFDDNFWSLGTENSPGGPTVEFYVDGIEVWNLVFNEYVLKNGNYEPSNDKGVDTGAGFERLLAVLNNKETIFETELFAPIIEKIEELSGYKYGEKSDEEHKKVDGQCWVDARKSFRIIADHIKASVFMISDGVVPSNVGRGYVVRRLVRRAVRYGKQLGIENNFIIHIASAVVEVYEEFYPELKEKEKFIFEELKKEENKFMAVISDGLKKSEKVFKTKKPIENEIYNRVMRFDDKKEVFRKLYRNREDQNNEFKKEGIKITTQELLNATISGKEAFDLYQTYGFPIEMIIELVQARNLFVDIEDFEKELKQHQELSRTASAGMFKGGLADSSEETKKLHTAAHLLLAALRKVLGEDVYQKGSNITSERLRFDFSYPEKLTPEQIKKTEDLVNEAIAKKMPVVCDEMSLAEAKKKGAMGVFEAKYGEKVKVYKIGEMSNEICGGPHVDNTGALGRFKITKEESSSAGVRRIKAVLE
jgi:alanyl-tRNA synthetase